MTDTTQFDPDDLIRQRMDYAVDEHVKLLVINADLKAEIERLTAVIAAAQEDLDDNDTSGAYLILKHALGEKT